MLPKLVDLLDLRPREEAEQTPIEDSVNIPVAELRDRLHELPRPTRLLRIYHPAADSIPVELHKFLHESRDQAHLSEKLPPTRLGWRPFADQMPTLNRPQQETLQSSVSICAHPRFQVNQGCRLWEPNDLLKELPAKPGKALDLGCGSGRDAVALACLGWQVTACDHLPNSLELAKDLERRYSDGIPIEWIEKDLRQGPPQSTYDLVTALFFWKPDAILQASHQLTPGGTLLIEMFTPTDRERHGKPKHPTDAEELKTLFPHLEVVSIHEDWRPSGRHTVRAVFSRP